ncbi:cell division inhibitor SepF [Thermoactinomyces sp. DSM 45891]|nr:cell division inhibitor SepF [Thermoactinomyces sp. DSM 45891]
MNLTFMNRVMNFFGVNEDEEQLIEENESGDAHPSPTKGKSNIVSLHSQKNVRLMLIEPRVFEETQEIADNLKSHRPVVVNLHRVRRDQATRVIDFLSGTVYALGGSIQRVGAHIFICTPSNVDVQGTITEILQDDAL